MEKYEEKKQRVAWIDCAKGGAIFLVIIGHSVGNGMLGSIVRALIFSFHMPLFLTLSCITYKYSSSKEEFIQKLKKSFRHLIVPALSLYVLEMIIESASNVSILFSFHFWREKALTLFFASGVSLDYYGIPVNCLGMMWFLFALYIGRTLLDCLNLHIETGQLKIFVCIIGCMGVLFGSIQWLPFSIDIALAVIPILYYGKILQKRNYRGSGKQNLGLWFLIWIGTLLLEYPDWRNWTYMELATRRYPMFPICYLTAIAGINITCIISEWISDHFKKFFYQSCILARIQ